MPFAAGEKVGSYLLIEQLGQGGMATVFKAYHAALDRNVAIKVLHVAFNEDPNFLARFQREARVVARLEHPNIVPIYDFSEHEGRPYLVMKFIEGETLKARLDRGLPEKSEIMAVLEAVGSALGYAHRQGVLHRDIKPSNVLLAGDGQIYLADFGLARIAQSGESSLTADRLVGTPQYISPEQALSKPDLDARTDVYSLGVMLYELLVGRVPFNADTPFAIIHDHIYTPLPVPSQVNPAVSAEAEQVLMKALAKDRNDRYSAVPELVNAMRSALPGSQAALGGWNGSGPAGLEQTALLDLDAPSTQLSPALPVTQQQPSPLVLPFQDGADYPANPADAAPGWQPAPGGVEISQPAVPRTSRRKWVGIGLAGVGLVLVLLIVAGAVRSNLQSREAAATQTSAAVQATRTLNPALAKARSELSGAVTAWKRGDLPGATLKLTEMARIAGDDPLFYKEALDFLVQNKAWLLAGIMLFSPDTPKTVEGLLQQRERVQQIHFLLYMSASDPLAGNFLSENATRPFFLVAPIRYQLFFGDTKKAKSDLEPILGSAEQVRAFPEAKLLEVEMLMKSDPISARQKLDALLKQKDTVRDPMPDWVRQIGMELDKQIPR